MATATDLQTFLGVPSIDEPRATMLIGFATALAQSIAGDSLPSAADGVILSAVARAYANPTGVTSENIGGYSASRPWAGVYLTRAERTSLKTLSGIGAGAFTIDPTPVDAMSGYMDALDEPDIDTAEDIAMDYPAGY